MFPIFVILVALYVLPGLDPTTTYLVLAWSLITLVAWFSYRPLTGRNNLQMCYELDRLTIWPLTAGYLIALAGWVYYDFEWGMYWVGVIHLYCILHARANHSTYLCTRTRVSTVSLLIFSLGAPITLPLKILQKVWPK